VLGVIMAGGQSTRFGSPKALALVGGERVVDRVARTLSSVTTDVMLIANDEAVAREIGIAWRPDRVHGLGPLGGFDAALAWAEERSARGILVAGCDMPFLSASLLFALLQRADATGADAVLPESEGPRGMEPLTAYYGIGCIPAIRSAIARGDHRLIAFHGDVHMERLSLAAVREHGDPARMFMNMNTPDDLSRANTMMQHGA
jgi:molybdopterin-guanine dinucleotide biosynthesis protein A